MPRSPVLPGASGRNAAPHREHRRSIVVAGLGSPFADFCRIGQSCALPKVAMRTQPLPVLSHQWPFWSRCFAKVSNFVIRTRRPHTEHT